MGLQLLGQGDKQFPVQPASAGVCRGCPRGAGAWSLLESPGSCGLWGGLFSTRLCCSCSITWSLASELELLPTCMGRAFGKKTKHVIKRVSIFYGDSD